MLAGSSDFRMLTRDEGVKGFMIRLQCVCCPGGTSGISVKDVPHLQREFRIKAEAVELKGGGGEGSP